MKADLNKILAVLQQLEQNPNFKSRPLVTSKEDNTADNISSVTDIAVTPSSSTSSIPPLQPHRKALTLPSFGSSDQEKTLDSSTAFVTITPPPTLMEEIQIVVQQIESLYREGPIVDGWLESYACESTSSNDETVNDSTTLEYVTAGSLEKDKIICEAPRSCYRLNGVDKTGQQWSYPCPIEQLPSVSLAIARYEKLTQLCDRKRNLETRLKQM
ncbi:MAG: hypothetical protein KME01_06685 [Chroococcus sp. CMT-3BRIN-NPC107]|jgi:hypothetical protein|nr:hypothetical protein [Chroococcus sp. CMT-3BRIN-NPC107]